MVAARALFRSFLGPEHVRDCFRAVPVKSFIGRTSSVRGLADELSPAVGVFRSVRGGVVEAETDGRGAVGVPVNRFQQLHVVRIRTRVAQIVRIVHAGILVGSVFARMTESEIVTDLLAHDVLDGWSRCKNSI